MKLAMHVCVIFVVIIVAVAWQVVAEEQEAVPLKGLDQMPGPTPDWIDKVSLPRYFYAFPRILHFE
jgi:hypothetical protein